MTVAERRRRLIQPVLAGLIGAALLGGGAALGRQLRGAEAVPVGSAEVAGLISPNLPGVEVDGASINYVNWVTPSSELPGTLYEVVRSYGPGQGSVICDQETVSPGTTATCPDYAVRPDTRYGYTIRAVLGDYWRSEATVYVRTADLTLELDLSDSAPAAGQVFAVTAIRALRPGGFALAESYSGWKTIRWTGLAASPGGRSPDYPADVSRILFRHGQALGLALPFTSYTEGPNLLVATDSDGTASGTGTATVTSGPAVGLAFGQQPVGSVGAGQTLTSSPQVYVIDGYGNIVGEASDPVQLALVGAGQSRAVLNCAAAPNGATAANFGVATYADCRITGPAGEYRLEATSPGLEGTGASGSLAIGPPTH